MTTITATGGTSQHGTLPINRTQWAKDFLKTGGWPVSQQNIWAVLAWMKGENTKAGWNPLATTLGASGATNFNSVGVKNYPSYQSGIQASVDTVKHSPAYSGIDNALSQGNSAVNVLNSIINTGTWTGTAARLSLPFVIANSANVNFLPVKGAVAGGTGGVNIPLLGHITIPGLSGAETVLTAITSGQFWIKIGMYILGSALVIGGLIMFNSDTVISVGKEIV